MRTSCITEEGRAIPATTSGCIIHSDPDANQQEPRKWRLPRCALFAVTHPFAIGAKRSGDGDARPGLMSDRFELQPVGAGPQRRDRHDHDSYAGGDKMSAGGTSNGFSGDSRRDAAGGAGPRQNTLLIVQSHRAQSSTKVRQKPVSIAASDRTALRNATVSG